METIKYVDENGNLVDQEKRDDSPDGKRGLQRVRSGSNLSALKQEKGKDIDES